MISVNLIPKWRRQQRKLRARRRAWVIAGCVYAALLAIGYTAWRFAWSGDARDVGGQLAIARHDVDEMAHNAAAQRGSLAETRRALAVKDALLGQGDFSLLLALAGRLRGDEIVLNRCGLDAATRGPESLPGDPIAPPKFAIQGFGRSQAAVSQFALRLERSGPFQSVSILKSNREPFLTGEAVAFRLECLLRTEAPQADDAQKPDKARAGGPIASMAEPDGRLP